MEESTKFNLTFYKVLREENSKIETLKAARYGARAKESQSYFCSGSILYGEGWIEEFCYD